MTIFNKIKKFITRPTAEESYEAGKLYCEQLLSVSNHMADDVSYLYGMAFGGFNLTESHRQFDRGFLDALNSHGFESPY